MSKPLKNKKNVEDEAAQREIAKLRSEVPELRHNCGEKEKSFKILGNNFIESRTKIQSIPEEKNKLKEIMGKKVSELEASHVEKDKHIVSLEAELKRTKEGYKAKTSKIRLASAEAAIHLSAAQVKIGDLNDEINHMRKLNENYRILMTNCNTLGKRCCNKLTETFFSTEAIYRERNFADGYLEGIM